MSKRKPNRPNYTFKGHLISKGDPRRSYYYAKEPVDNISVLSNVIKIIILAAFLLITLGLIYTIFFGGDLAGLLGRKSGS